MAKVLLEAKAVALHPEWYQSSLSKVSKGGGEMGKEAQAIGLAHQLDRQKSDRQTGDRWIGRKRPMSVGTQENRAAS